MTIETAKLNIESDLEALIWLRAWQYLPEMFKKDRADLTELSDYLLAKYPELEYKGSLYRVSHVTDEKLEDFIGEGKTTLNKLSAYSFSTDPEAIEEFAYFNTEKYSDIPIQKQATGLDVNKAVAMLTTKAYRQTFGADANKLSQQVMLNVLGRNFRMSQPKLAKKFSDNYAPLGIKSSKFSDVVFSADDYDDETEVLVKGPISITTEDVMQLGGEKAIVLSQPLIAKYKLSLTKVPVETLRRVVPKRKLSKTEDTTKPEPKATNTEKPANNLTETNLSWWKSKSKEFQADYLEQHPKSKFQLAASLKQLPVELKDFRPRTGNYYVGLDGVITSNADLNKITISVLAKFKQIAAYCKKYKVSPNVVVNANAIPVKLQQQLAQIGYEIIPVVKTSSDPVIASAFYKAEVSPPQFIYQCVSALFVLLPEGYEDYEEPQFNDYDKEAPEIVPVNYPPIREKLVSIDPTGKAVEEFKGNMRTETPTSESRYSSFDLAEQGTRTRYVPMAERVGVLKPAAGPASLRK